MNALAIQRTDARTDRRRPFSASKSQIFCNILGWLALIGVPWYGTPEGIFSGSWIGRVGASHGAALVHLLGGRVWLLPLALPLLVHLIQVLRAARRQSGEPGYLLGCGLFGLFWLAVLAFSIDIRGWTWDLPSQIFGALPRRMPGFGAGAWLYGLVMMVLTCWGFAARGAFGGDKFSACSVGLVSGVLCLFVAYPLLRVGLSALQTPRGVFAPELFWQRIGDPRIWRAQGVAANSMLLGICSAFLSTVLALAFVLLTERTRMPGRKMLRAISVLPIITPPFVIGLAIILLFGRSGALNHVLEAVFGIEPTRWIYGFKGILFAQVLSFAPIAYLVIVGVVQGLNPALEEAAQTLRAGPMRLFMTVTLPLILPGLANAFLVCFIESLADFGNPLLLGGDFDVLATSIYFSVVGARADRGFAAVLSLILLVAVLAVFLLQRGMTAGRMFTTIAGKGQAGTTAPLPGPITGVAALLAFPWVVLTLALYGTVLAGGFVENLGLNASLTMRHYAAAFGISLSETLPRLTGQAWDSLMTTLSLAAIAAPLTALVGLLAAHSLSRQSFRGRGIFELGTLLAAAVPGTVLGIAYVLAFNNPPLELAGTATIVIISFVVRNMGVGVRAGIAGLSQIDRSLEEASVMLRASAWRTMRQVVMPLLRPAIIAATVYGFVAAMTTVSAVIFLVSPGVMLSTVFIINVAEAGTYGMAIAAASVLIVVMLLVIVAINRLIGERTIRRPAAAANIGGLA